MRKALLTILIGAFGVSLGFSQKVYQDGDWFYTVSASSEATIKHYLGTDNEVAIPSSVGGFPVRTVGAGGVSRVFRPPVTSVIIPDGVTSIGGFAFDGCTSLTSVTIPSSVTSIGNDAFSGCTHLTSVAIPDGVTTIGRGTFFNCIRLATMTIPASVTSIGDSAFAGCTLLPRFVVSAANPSYRSIYGVLFSKDETELVAFPGGRSGSYVVPESVTSIWAYAFAGCTALASVTIPSSVTSIGAGSFARSTNLKSVYFLGNPPSLSWNVFLGIDPPGKVYYPQNSTEWTSDFGGWATEVRSTPPLGLRAQTVRLSLPGKVVYGSTYKLKASASSKLPLIFSVNDPDIAELTGRKIKILQAKPFEVTAEQAGNEKWAPNSKTITVTPSKRPQLIGFSVKSGAKVGDVLNLNVTLKSGLPVTITSSDVAKVRIDGMTATALAPGKVTLTATQAGDDNHEAAKPVNKTVVVTNPAPSAPSRKVAKFRSYQPWGNRIAVEMETTNVGIYVLVLDSWDNASGQSVWRGESIWRGDDAWTSWNFDDDLRSWRPADLYNEAPDEFGVAWVTFDQFGLTYMNNGTPPLTWDNVDSMDGPLPGGGLEVFLPGALDWAIQDDGGIFFDSRKDGAGENANTMFDYVDTISDRGVAIRDPDDSKLTLYVGGYEALYEVTPFETIKHNLSAYGASSRVNKLEYSGSRLWISYNGRILTLSNGQISLFADASGPLSGFGLDNFCIANGNVYASNGLRYPMSGGPGVPWIKRSGALNPTNPAELELMLALPGAQLFALKNAVSSQIFFLHNNKIYVVDPL